MDFFFYYFLVFICEQSTVQSLCVKERKRRKRKINREMEMIIQRRKEEMTKIIRRCPAKQPNRTVNSSNKLFLIFHASAGWEGVGGETEQVEFYIIFLAINYYTRWKMMKSMVKWITIRCACLRHRLFCHLPFWWVKYFRLLHLRLARASLLNHHQLLMVLRLLIRCHWFRHLRR